MDSVKYRPRGLALMASLMLSAGTVLAVEGPDKDSILKRVHTLVGSMTLEEKIEQLHGMGLGVNEFGDMKAQCFGTKGNDRVKIPPLIMGHGITGARVGRDPSVKGTYFGTPMAFASTWDPDLYRQVARGMARELRALGQDLILGPTLNIIRNPQGGRSWESYSEDPFLTARFIVPYAKAVQSEGVICGPKHFAANNQEGYRFDINNVIDERTLHEIYLPAFKAAVMEGGALNIMCAYNRVNGVFMSENRFLLTDILRGQWGFEGFVISDFALAMHSTEAPVAAGMNVEMDGEKYYGKLLLEAVRQKRIPESRIDELVEQKLYAMALMGILDGTRTPVPRSEIHCSEHQALALEVARTSPILMKNEGGILPLDRKKVKRILIAGPNAERPAKPGAKNMKVEANYAHFLQGGGSGRCYYFPDALVTPLKGIKAYLGDAVDVLYAPGPKAVELAGSCDVVLLMLGLSGDIETEGRDRRNCRLPDDQQTLVREIVKVNPKTIVVLITGSYVEPGDWMDKVPGLLACFYSGEKIGQGLAEILFGEISPSGKLSVSWPRSLGAYPKDSIYLGEEHSKNPAANNNVYKEGIWVGYRCFDRNQSPLAFPFGYGLSYTAFQISDMNIGVSGRQVTVSVKVRNTGARAGAEVVQVYVGQPGCSVERPIRELKGFFRTYLQPGEMKTVVVSLGPDAFSYWSPAKKAWTLEPGEFVVEVGASSRDIRCKSVIAIQ